jgi:hypothetical protein
MLTSCAAVTVNVVCAPSEFIAAAIVEVPVCLVVARPLELMVATVALLELHVTELEMSCVDPSEYVPVAVNCCALPAGCDGFAGEMAID